MERLILPKNLVEIGQYAFMSSYAGNGFSKPVTIIIGSNVTTMGDRTISNLGNNIPVNGVYIMIGEEGNPSELLFSNNPNPIDSNGRVFYDGNK